MKYVAILRGINVSGKNLIKMDALRISMEGLGFQSVVTYIQSGNICFESNLQDNLEIAAKLKDGIEKNFQLTIPVLVFKEEEFDKIVNENPFVIQSNFDTKFMHITFLESDIDSNLIPQLEDKCSESEQLFCQGKAVYLYLQTGYGTTKLSNNFIEKILKNLATTRNWNTCLELQKILIG